MVQKNKEICVGHCLVVPKDGDAPECVAYFTDILSRCQLVT